MSANLTREVETALREQRILDDVWVAALRASGGDTSNRRYLTQPPDQPETVVVAYRAWKAARDRAAVLTARLHELARQAKEKH